MSGFESIPLDLPLFEGIPAEKVDHVLRCLNVKLVHYGKHETIFSHARPSSYTGYLCEGQALIISNDVHGNRSILSECKPGSVLAAEQFFKLESSIALDVIASTECTLLLFNLQQEVEAKPCCMAHVNRIRANLAASAIQMNTELLGKLEIVANRSTREKLLAYLGDQAQLNGSTSFDIPLNRQELADTLYVERSALSRELSKLAKEGVVSYSGRHFEVRELPIGA